MAKKNQLDYGSISLDDDLDFDFGDSTPTPPKSKGREVVGNVADGVATGLKNHLGDRALLGRMLKKSLPAQYSDTWDTLDQGASTIGALYDDAAKELKPGLSVLSRKIDNLVPESALRTKAATSKLRRMFESAPENQNSSKQAMEDEGVNRMLQSTFAAQFEQSEAIRKQDGETKKLDDMVQTQRHRQSASYLSRIDDSLLRMSQATMGVAVPAQKKGLELSFRTYFTLAEIARDNKEGQKKQFELLQGILKNTSLPEFVKITDSERFHQLGKDKLIGAIQQKLFGEGSRINQGLKSLAKEGEEFVQGIKSGIEMATMGIELGEQMKELNDMMADIEDKKPSKGRLAGQMAGAMGGSWVENKVTSKIRARLEKNDKLMEKGYEAARYAADPGALINKFDKKKAAEAELDPFKDPEAKGAVGWFLNHFRLKEQDLKGQAYSGIADLGKVTLSDERLRRVQIDVVPGLLARILRSTEGLRTGTVSDSLLAFDYRTNTFKDQKLLGSELRKSLLKNVQESGFGHARNRAVKNFDDGDMTDAEKDALAKVFTKFSRMADFDFTSENIRGSKEYQSQSKKVQASLDKHVLSKMEAPGSEGAKKRMEFTQHIQQIRRNTTDLGGEIDKMIQAGYAPMLQEQGIITMDGEGGYEIDKDKYYALLEEGTTAKSDINAKENISSSKPKDMLEKIRKMKVFNWSYKDGEGPQGQHQGPMAQDVRSVLGDKAAPGGRKIDLVSMNGANMQAIQALADEQQNMLESSQNSLQLQKIGENTSRLVELFEKGGMGGGIGPGTQPSRGEGDLFDNIAGLGRESWGMLRGGVRGVAGGVKTAGDVGKAFFDKHKDVMKDTASRTASRALRMAERGMEWGSNLIFSSLPSGLDKVNKLLGKAWNKISDWSKDAKDIFIQGRQGPVMQAVLMRAGAYRDKVSGQVIKTLDDLKALKGDVVNAAGETVLTLQEAAQGLYDQGGRKITTKLGTVGALGAHLLSEGAGALWRNTQKLATNAKGMFDTLKDKSLGWKDKLMAGKQTAGQQYGSFKERFSNLNFGFSTQRNHDVLLQIRDLIAIGKPGDLVKEILDRPIGKLPSSSAMTNPVQAAKESAKKWAEKLKGGLTAGVDKAKGFFGLGGEDAGDAPTVNADGSPRYQGDGIGSLFSGAKNALGGLLGGKKADDALVGPPKPGEAPGRPSLMDRLKEKKDALQGRWKSGTRGGDFQGPTQPKTPGKWAGRLQGGMRFGKRMGQGLLGGAASLASGLLGGGQGDQPHADPQANHSNDAPSESRFGGLKSVFSKIRGGVARAGGAFNDKDGDGQRDGNWADQLRKRQDERARTEERNQQSAKEAAERAGTGDKYRSGENIIDGMINKVKSLFGTMQQGAAGLAEAASGAMDAFDSLKKGGKGAAGKVAGAGGKMGMLKGALKVGAKGLGLAGAAYGGYSAYQNVKDGNYGSAALDAGMAVGGLAATGTLGTVVAGGTAALGGAAAVAGGAASAIAGVLASPVVLTGLAVAGTAYGLYKAFSYFTRDRLDDWEKMRVAQYGLDGSDEQKKYNHVLMNLEGYLLDKRVGYTNGRAYLLDKKIKPEEILELFSIEKTDTAQAQKLATWLEMRFKPFFLQNVSTLFALNPKIKLDQIDKLTAEQKVEFIDKAEFLDGPYQASTSPFKDLDRLSGNRLATSRAVDALRDKFGKEAKKKAPSATSGSSNAQKAADRLASKSLDEAVKLGEQSQDKLNDPDTPDSAKKAVDELGPGKMNELINQLQTGKKTAAIPASTQTASEDGGKEPKADGAGTASAGGKPNDEGAPAGAPTPALAGGPVRDGSGGEQYMNLGKNAKLEGVHPALLQAFKAMAQEYGETTKKKITVTQAMRSTADQARLYQENPRKAAKPGTSLHEFGLALDVDSKDLDALDKMGLMKKYGFTRPIGGETWHIEAAGLQSNLQQAKKDSNFAAQGIKMSMGRGGGGYGSIRGTPLGRRNNELAMKLFNEKGTPLAAKDTAPNEEIQMGGKGDDQWVSADSATKPQEASQKTAVASATSGVSAPKESPTDSGSPIAGQQAKGIERSEQATQQAVASAPVGAPPQEAKPVEGETQPSSSAPSSGGGGAKGDVKEQIASAAKEAGGDPALLQTFAAVESGLKPTAKASGGSAEGLYGFIKSTWREQLNKFGSKYRLSPETPPTDVRASTLMAKEYLDRNKKAIASVKPNPNIADMYFTHFLGGGGANKFLGAKQDAIGADLLPDAARANKPIFFGGGRPLTTGEIYKNITKKLTDKAKAFSINLPSMDGSMGANPAGPSSSASAVTGGAPLTPVTGAPTASPTSPSAAAGLTLGSAKADEVMKGSTATPVESTPTPEKTKPKYPWVSESAPVDPVQVRKDGGKGSGQADYAAMSGMGTVLESSLKVQGEMRDAIVNRVAPSLEAIVKNMGLLKGTDQPGSQSNEPSTNPMPGKPRAAVSSALDLRRSA